MHFILFIFFSLFIYLFIYLAVLGLRCCTQAFLQLRQAGATLPCNAWFLIVVASLVAEHRLQACGLSSCGSRALERRLSSCGAQVQLPCGMWDLPRPGLKPVSPALAGGFLTTAPPGRSLSCILKVHSLTQQLLFQVLVLQKQVWTKIFIQSVSHGITNNCKHMQDKNNLGFNK